MVAILSKQEDLLGRRVRILEDIKISREPASMLDIFLTVHKGTIGEIVNFEISSGYPIIRVAGFLVMVPYKQIEIIWNNEAIRR